MHVLRTP
ncbi:MAG: hypothetical protein JRD89_19090, partial [Deltaproteobacteria bacterium]|nr:hypothetical protein [Deltaproteobacteria bacterium]